MPFEYRYIVGGLLLLGLGAVAAGCATVDPPAAPSRPSPARPEWQEAYLREHLRFFNASTVAGRATGSEGYSTAAAYLAARMREFEMQPALHQRFRLSYPLSRNAVQDAELRVSAPSGADTLTFRPHVDYLPDGRSDSGRVEIREVLIGLGETPRSTLFPQDRERGAFVMAERATTNHLRSLRDAGATAVLIVGSLTPNVSEAPIAGLVIMQVTPEAAARLANMTPTALNRHLARSTVYLRANMPTIRISIEATYEALAEGINTLGYVSGKHPARSKELVLVCADLDAFGEVAGVPMLDGKHVGVGAAALLEVARHYGYVAQFWNVPERTLLFAVWSGARMGHRGLQAYLQQPLWPLDRTRAVVYLGLEAAATDTVRAMLQARGLPLYVVAPPDQPLYEEGHVVLPAASAQRRAERRRRREADLERLLDFSAIMGRAVEHARHVAEEAYKVVFRESVDPAPYQPVRVRALMVPVEDQTESGE